MMSFLLPGALAAWAALTAWMSFRVAAWVDPSVRTGFKALVFAALLPLPLIDEILAQPQFNAVCREMAVVTLHDRASRDRVVILSALAPEPVPGLLVPVMLHKSLYLDAVTRQPLLSLNTLHTGAGKLAGLFGATRPLVFTGACEPPERQRMLDALGLRVQDGAAPLPVPAP